ncbi:MAG TPA: alpha/beta fold hydrolase [Chloroflexota bacterium]|nr:alpha/beta fold hydrolase [Chloroflexota bacterium]
MSSPRSAAAGVPAADPHAGQPVLAAGEPLARARVAVVMLHGRGATAESILDLAEPLATPGVAYLAPQAAGGAWYPYRFMDPVRQPEAWLTSALAAVDRALVRVERAGVPAERTVLLGFSQGGCLALEYAARHARRYGGVVGLSAGLIGPPGTRWDYPAAFAGTPVFLGCAAVDPHIPRARVDESADALRRLGADVTERIYPGMGHTVNQDEVDWVRDLLTGLTAGA